MGGAGGARVEPGEPDFPADKELPSSLSGFPWAMKGGVPESSRAFLYAPRHPLWTNGSDKARYVVVPSSEQITWSSRGPEFPTGTIFFKTFSYELEGSVQLVETRVIRKLADGYEFHAYRWDQDGKVAERLDGSRPVAVAVLPASGAAFEHMIPSRLECRSCHENGEQVILGFSEVQLAGTTRMDGGSVLEALVAQGIAAEVPEAPRTLDVDESLRSRVLSYLEGNCVHCHDGGQGPNSGFSLRFEVAEENLVGVETESELWSGLRVAPGDPSKSALYRALLRDESTGGTPMPPLGVQVRDEAGAQLISDYILSLTDE